jgi:hypothetical protein
MSHSSNRKKAKPGEEICSIKAKNCSNTHGLEVKVDSLMGQDQF